MLCPGVHLLFQVEDVADHVGALDVALRIAGPGEVEAVVTALDERNELAGVLKICLGGVVWVHVSPQGQDVFNAHSFQTVQQPGYLVPGIVDAGQVGHRGDVVLVLNGGGNAAGQIVSGGAARSKGDADVVGAEVLKLIQGSVDGFNGAGLFRWEYFTGENHRFLLKELCNAHGRVSFRMRFHKR